VKVGIDLDDVVFDFVDAFFGRYYEWFDENPWYVKEFDDLFERSRFATREEMLEWCDDAEVWERCGYVPGAPGGIQSLLACGHQVSFITSRTGAGADWAREWHSRSVFGFGTSLACGFHGGDKAQVKCGLYLDDNPETVRALREHGKRAVLFRREWHDGYEGVVVDNWGEFLELVEGVEHE
jgi:hypothetical protein